MENDCDPLKVTDGQIIGALEILDEVRPVRAEAIAMPILGHEREVQYFYIGGSLRPLIHTLAGFDVMIEHMSIGEVAFGIEYFGCLDIR